MKVAVHQPNFMPWLGIFHKAAMADTFVVLDHVQAMGGSSWMTRNRILVRGEPRWLTMPVERSGTGLPAVNEVRVLWAIHHPGVLRCNPSWCHEARQPKHRRRCKSESRHCESLPVRYL